MTWKEIQEHIEKLSDEQKNKEALLCDTGELFYMVTRRADIPEEEGYEPIIDEPCFWILKL